MEDAVTSLAPPPQPVFRVYLVEDSDAVRERMLKMLAGVPGMTCVGHASGVADAIRGILLHRPDAVVLDVRLADGNGFEVLRAVRERAPSTAIYMLSNFSAEPYRRLARQLGAEEFFDKSTELESMWEALNACAAQAH